MSEMIFLSAAAMAEQIRQKKISRVESLEVRLAQIKKLNLKLHAFV